MDGFPGWQNRVHGPEMRQPNSVIAAHSGDNEAGSPAERTSRYNQACLAVPRLARERRASRRDGRVAEGGGLLNRYRVKSSIGGSNPPLSASRFQN